MLHKMGWKEGEKIGRNPLSYRQELHTIEPRAPGLGLGALSKQNINQDNQTNDKSKSTGANELKKYGSVYVIKGRHKGIKGVLIRIENDLCVLEVNEEEIVLPADYVSAEYVKIDNNSTNKIKRERDWLHKNISVRIISKKYKDGVYYRKKGKIVDCVDRTTFICLDNGEFLEEVKEKYLEPFVTSESVFVYVVKGAHKGKVGEVLQFDSYNQEFTVEDKTDHNIFTVPIDCVAEYID